MPAMERRRLRELLVGPPPAPDRIFFTSLWFKGHNNPRYAELLPRLRRLDGYLLVFSDRRIPRGLQHRAYHYSRHLRNPVVMRLGGRRYQSCFTADPEQIPGFTGGAVADVDDPRFTPREAAALAHPNLRAYVVTAEKTGERYRELGVDKPYHVIPQGVSLASLTDSLVEEARARRRPGEVVVGYTAAFLLTDDDYQGANTLYNVSHLLELWDRIHSEAPEARLWLIGSPSERVRALCRGRDDIELCGLLPRDEALARASAFDIALYPRTKDQGIRSVKVAEYIGVGVPTVSYDYAVTEELRETGAGLLVGSPRDFAETVVRLVREPAERAPLAEAARRAARERDWDVLAKRYETEILDRWLPPGKPS
jgi:glycosyltransferase involved in cell wall biosynthesis